MASADAGSGLLRRGCFHGRARGAATARLGRFLGIVGRGDVERRRQAIGLEAVAFATGIGRLRRRRAGVAIGRNYRLRITPRPTATGTLQRRIGFEHGLGAVDQRLAFRERIRPALTGDLDGLLLLEPRAAQRAFFAGAVLTGPILTRGTLGALLAGTTLVTGDAILMRRTVLAGSLPVTASIFPIASWLARLVAVLRGAARWLAILAVVASRAVVAGLTVIPRAVIARLAIVALLTVVAAVAVLLAGADRLAFVAIIVVAIELERLLAARLLVLEPATLVGDHTEIVIGELQIIFGVDPVALTLRIAGEILVLLEQLIGIAACAAVDPVAIVGTTLAATLTRSATTTVIIIVAATTATTAVLPIVDQANVP